MVHAPMAGTWGSSLMNIGIRWLSPDRDWVNVVPLESAQFVAPGLAGWFVVGVEGRFVNPISQRQEHGHPRRVLG